MQPGDGLFREIRKRALAQGWRVEPTSGGHIRFVPPDPRHSHVIASGTPSCGRALKHLVSDLKRRGFSNKPARPERAQTERAPTFEQAAEASSVAVTTTITPSPENVEKTSNDMSTNTTERLPRTTEAPARPKEFKDALRSAREAEGLTVDALAELLNVSRATVYNWENGATPGAEFYQRLCTLFDGLRELDRPRRQPGGRPSRAKGLESPRGEPGPSAADGQARPSDNLSGKAQSPVAEALRLFTGLRGIARETGLLDLLVAVRDEGLDLNDVIDAMR